MNLRRILTDEIVSLGALRVQKVYGLFNSMLAMELYSKTHKRLYFIVDQNQKSRSVHVQIRRPFGVKTKSAFTMLLSKYAENRTIVFYSMNEEGSTLKGQIYPNDHSYALIIELEPLLAVGFFRDNDLLSTLKQNASPKFHALSSPSFGNQTGILQNEKIASLHEQYLIKHHQNAFFNQRLQEIIRETNKKKNLLKNVLRDYDKCQASLKLSQEAELIKQNLHSIKRGQDSVLCVDYNNTEPKPKLVKLDRRLSPKVFLEKIFNKIRKAKRGLLLIEPRIALIKSEIEMLEKQVSNLLEAGQAAILAPYLLEDFKNSSIKQKKERLPYRKYLSKDGINILVARSAKDSDTLTKHHCRGNEWWLHARDVTGAHVVIKSTLDQLPERTLLEAALLAIAFSKAKTDSHACVQYTRGKYVKKQKNAKVGQVLVAQEKTIEISPNPVWLKELLSTEGKSSTT